MIEAGQPIKVGELSLTVIQELSAGRNKRTYKVEDQRGVLYIYKYTKKREIKKEVERAAMLARLGLQHSKVVASGSESTRRSRGSRESRRTVERLERSSGRDRDREKERESSRTGYVLREWIDGVRGDDWLKSWQSFGASADSSGVQALIALLDKAARAGMYVGHLNPEYLVYNDPAFSGTSGSVPRDAGWYIVDCGSIVELPARDAATRYFWKVLERWGSKLQRHLSHAGKGVIDANGNLVVGKVALEQLFTALLLLGADYPVPVALDTPLIAVSPLSVSSKRREIDDPDPSDGARDDDSSGDVDDDDSSGSLPPDSQSDDDLDVSPIKRRDENEAGKGDSFVVKGTINSAIEESSHDNTPEDDPTKGLG